MSITFILFFLKKNFEWNASSLESLCYNRMSSLNRFQKLRGCTVWSRDRMGFSSDLIQLLSSIACDSVSNFPPLFFAFRSVSFVLRLACFPLGSKSLQWFQVSSSCITLLLEAGTVSFSRSFQQTSP